LIPAPVVADLVRKEPTMSDDFPHSPEYFTRQASRQKEIDRLRQRQTWTDAQFLAERDAAYVAEQRKYLGSQIADQERDMQDDNDIEGYVRKYFTDEG